jgi:signal transduction histidine kinase
MEELVKEDFLGLISHKLRTPLAGIGGNLSLLQDGSCGPLADRQRKAVDSASKEFSVLVLLVEKLLGFIAVYSQKLDHPKKRIELKSYLPIITDAIVGRAENKNVEVGIECQEDANVVMNKTYLDLVVGNLVENAIKHNDKDVSRISVVVKKIPGTVEISITDNGRGIPNEEYERIFEMFYQVEKNFTGQVGGFGLGLAVVKKLIEREGGEIHVISRLGQGTAFTFTLPADDRAGAAHSQGGSDG